jgi:hypothetical protein
MTLAGAHEAYQGSARGAWAHPESEELAEDLEDARRKLEVLWLHSALGARG